MKKYLFSLMLAGAALAAAEFDFRNADFELTFDTKGASVSRLIYRNTDWNAAGPRDQGNSFNDARLGQNQPGKIQNNENFYKLEYALSDWKSYKTTGWADITFTARGTVLTWLRMYKTYRIRTGNTLEVVYELCNTGKTPQPLSFSTRWFFNRTDRENLYWMPHAKGVEKRKQQRYMFFSKLPPQAYLAVTDLKNDGLVLRFPADATAGVMNWFIRGKSASTEYFSDETVIPPGGKRVISISLVFVPDVEKYNKSAKYAKVAVKGAIPVMVDHLNQQESRDYKIRTLRAESTKETNFADLKLKRQFKDSWRSVILPEKAPLDKIAVFQLENGVPSFDRPVGYVLNGRELLLKIPGINPEGSSWRSTLKGGILAEHFGAKRVWGSVDFACRVFFDRADGLKLSEKAPAGGELVPNGSFETPDAKNPAAPANHLFVANRNFHCEYLQKGGMKDSRCLRGGEAVFPLISEPGRSYDVTLSYKNEGGNSMTRCWFFFYDAEGKRLMKLSTLFESSKKSTEWKTVRKRIFAPDGTAFMALSVSRSSKQPARVLLDDVSIKAEPLSCVQTDPLELAARKMKELWGVPLEVLQSLSFEVGTPLKKWFVPAADVPEVLYLPVENNRGRMLHDKRLVVELGQRMDMKIRMIPVLRQILSSTGVYGVYVATFGKDLSKWSAEALKKVTKAPKVVIITQLTPQQHGRDLEELFAKWQKEGTNFLILSGTFFPRLRGKPIAPPIDIFRPEMQKVAKDRSFIWTKRGKSIVVSCALYPAANPVIPADMVPSAARHKLPVESRDFPWWEYQYLGQLQILRYLAGIKPAAKFTAVGEKAVKIRAEKAFSGTLELACFNLFRELKAKRTIKCALSPGENTVALPELQLPGGAFTADLRLLDAKGRAVDAGAFRIDRATPVKIDVAFADPQSIFPQGTPVRFTVKLDKLPAGAELETTVEDTYGRVIHSRRTPAKGEQQFALELPAPRTVLNNLLLHVSAGGRVVAEGKYEFSSPAGPTDFTDFHSMTWGTNRYLIKALELDGGVASSPYTKNVQDLFRYGRLHNFVPSPMGLACRRGKEYRGDRKTDPVRDPCFSDPAYHARNHELISVFDKKNLLGYYDVRDFWSGDEQFLGSTVCYSPHCLKNFRARLKESYKSIDALNKEWGTSFDSFDKVVPQQLDELKSKDNLAPWLDHKMFMAAIYAWGQFGSHLPDLKKYNPHARMGASGTQQPGYSYDWVQYMKHCTVLSYYGGIQVKLIHDLGGKNLLAGRWGTYCHADVDMEPYCVSPMWAGLLRGANMAAIWPPTMINGDGAPLRNVRFAKNIMEELRSGITKLWLTGSAVPQIGILYSQSSLYTAMGTIGGTEWLNSHSSWLKLLDDMKYDCRYISYEALAKEGVPAQFKAVILPATLSISEAEAARLAEFVGRGGVLIADFAPGRFDGHGKKWNSATLAKLFAPGKGRIDVAYRDFPAAGGRIKVAEPEIPFEAKKSFGKGWTVNFNISLSDYHFIQLGGTGGETATAKSGDAKVQAYMRGLVKKYLDAAGVRPVMSVTDASGRDFPCMALLRKDGDTYTAALYQEIQARTKSIGIPAHHRFDLSKGHKLTAKLPVKGHIYEIRSGKYLGYGDTFASFLVPGIANFYAVEKSKVTGLRLSAPPKAAPGATVKVDFTAAGAQGPQVFNVRVTDPKGVTLKLYRKNYRTPGNSGQYTFQIPFNGAPGEWKVQVIHVNTGMKQTASVAVPAASRQEK